MMQSSTRKLTRILGAVILVGSVALLVSGCTGLKPGPDTEWNTIGPKIQSRVKYISMFAFSMEKVKLYKAQVCETTDQIIDLLSNYNDPEASLEAVRTMVMDLLIQIEDPNVRNAVTILVDMALTESFNFVRENYSDWIESDEIQAALTLAHAVAGGLRDACDLMATTVTETKGSHAQMQGGEDASLNKSVF